ncbi:MAG: hypothetical protein JOZ69_25020, partial [Myxococcales bacterium]|nr:hypothetical protein [Myxococcales bacterium]
MQLVVQPPTAPPPQRELGEHIAPWVHPPPIPPPGHWVVHSRTPFAPQLQLSEHAPGSALDVAVPQPEPWLHANPGAQPDGGDGGGGGAGLGGGQLDLQTKWPVP